MNLFRRLPTARLLALIAAVTAVAVISVVGIAAAVGDDPQPPPAKGLAEAIHDAIVAPPVQGVTARIEFNNDLDDAGAFEGVSPLISGASGRLWWTADHFRVELQGNSGDAQIVADDKSFWVYDGQSNTVYRGQLERHPSKSHRVPTVAQIQRKLTRVLRYAGIAGPDPGVEGGQPSYSVKVTPKKHGGLLGAIGLAWDATHGIPLRVGLYPKGSDSPVVELKASSIHFGSVDSSAFDISPPASARVVNIEKPDKSDPST
jgi:outer membrane lipoprotein-sorting protein